MPIQHATVKFQTHKNEVITDADGSFCLQQPEGQNIISAWKSGYFIYSQDINEQEVINLTLTAIPPNIASQEEAWQWLSSLHSEMPNHQKPDDFQPCEQCHEQITSEWKSSGHSGYSETSLFTQFLTPGVPEAQCSLCHTPLKQKTNSEGISCDYCHKINQVDISNSLLLGEQKIQHYFPQERQLFFGQLKDVQRANDSFHPLYERSEYCAACHEGRFWKTQVYSDYSEWKSSSWADKGVQCQDCHMDSRREWVANTDKGGVLRASDTLANHQFMTSKSDITKALKIDYAVEEDGEELILTIEMENTGAGHRIPAGNHMRHIILSIKSSDPQVTNQIKGSRIPGWVNDQNQGLPGNAYGKVLAPLSHYGVNNKKSQYPAPFWKNHILESDNRFTPNKAQTERFVIPKIVGISITIQLRLREYYANWLDLPAPKEEVLYSAEFSY